MRDVRRRLRLLAALLATLLMGADVAVTQVMTTTVQDTITNASGVAASGSVVVSWNAFTTAGGVSVPAGSTSATLGAGGVLTIALVPNAGATPMGSFYTAVFHLSDGTVSRQYWVVPVTVPGGGPAKLAAIQNQVLPTSVAMQTVSKQYVDTAIAAAVTGTVSGQNAVAITGGTINGTAIGGTTPAAGTFTTVNGVAPGSFLTAAGSFTAPSTTTATSPACNSGGSYASAGASVTYLIVGKLVWFSTVFSIANVGSCTGYPSMTLPWTSAGVTTVACRDSASSGSGGFGTMQNGGTTLAMAPYNNVPAVWTSSGVVVGCSGFGFTQ